MRSLENLVSKLDLFGIAPQFRIQGKSKKKTFIGGFYSLLLIIFSIIIIRFHSTDFFYWDSARVMYFSKSNVQTTQFTFAQNTIIPIDIQFYENNGNAVQSTDISFSIESISGSSANTYLGRPCSSFKLDPKASYYYYLNSNFRCLDIGGLKIGGSQDQLTINLNYCVNPTLCEISKQTNKYLSSNSTNLNYRLITYLPSFKIDPRNLEIYNLDYQYTRLVSQTNLIQTKAVYYKATTLNMDRGVFTENFSKKQVFTIDSQDNFSNSRSKLTDNTLFSIKFHSSDKEDVYIIWHQKAYEAITTCFLYILVLNFFFSFINFYLETHYFKQMLIQEYFTFEEKTDNISDSKKKIGEKTKALNSKHENLGYDNKSIYSGNQIIEMKSKTESENMGNIIQMDNPHRPIPDPKTSINLIFRKSVDYIELLRLRFEFDNLKRFVLNNSQYDAFAYIDRPKIFVSNGRLVGVETSPNPNKEEVINYFVQKINSQEATETDLKILLKLNNEISELISRKI